VSKETKPNPKDSIKKSAVSKTKLSSYDISMNIS